MNIIVSYSEPQTDQKKQNPSLEEAWLSTSDKSIGHRHFQPG